MERDELLQSVLERFRLFELAAGYHSRDYLEPPEATRASPLEIQILIQIDCFPGTGVSEIAKALVTERSRVSRGVNRLIEKSLIRTEPDSNDKRRIRNYLTHRAQAVLDFQKNFQRSLYRSMSANLTAQELRSFSKLLKRFADGEGVETLPCRPGESEITVQLRRLGRAHQIISKSFFGTGHNSLEWHILSSLYMSKRVLRPGQISRMLRIPASVVSVTLADLRKTKLISIKRDSVDSRQKRVHLLKKGEAALFRMRALAGVHLRESLAAFSIEEIKAFCSLFARYTSGESPSITTEQSKGFTIKNDIELLLVTEEEKLSDMRSFHVRSLFESDALDVLQPDLFQQSSICFALLQKQKLEGVFEVIKDEAAKKVVFTNCSVRVGALPAGSLSDCLKLIDEFLAVKYPGSDLVVSPKISSYLESLRRGTSLKYVS